MTYCFKCTECGATFELSSRSVPGCYDCGGELRRDYKAEGVAVDRFALRVGGTRAQRREPEGEGGVTFV